MMKPFARSSARRVHMLPRERLDLMRPARRRVVAAGLELSPIARDEGYADGLAGLVFDPQDLEPVSYAAGYLAGFGARAVKRSR